MQLLGGVGVGAQALAGEVEQKVDPPLFLLLPGLPTSKRGGTAG